MNPPFLSASRRLAATSLVLVSFAGFWRYSPAHGSAERHTKPTASTWWETLLQRCPGCANGIDSTVNVPRGTSSAENGTGSQLNAGAEIRAGEDFSFYGSDSGPVEPPVELRPASIELHSVQEAAEDAKPLPWPIPESVFFLYKTSPGDPRHGQRIGTAFVVSVPGESGRKPVRYLVTARHVVDPQWAQCTLQNPDSIQVRLNKRTGGVGYETLQLKNGRLRSFIVPSDDTSDLALIPLNPRVVPNLELYKFIEVPLSMIPNTDELKTLQPEQQIITAGLPRTPLTDSREYPGPDSGVLSTMPGEATKIHCGGNQPGAPAADKPVHLWFISVPTPNRTGGAPVYAAITRGQKGLRVPILLGIQSVGWPFKGVAGITPSPVLADLVRSAAIRHIHRAQVTVAASSGISVSLPHYRFPLPPPDTGGPDRQSFLRAAPPRSSQSAR